MSTILLLLLATTPVTHSFPITSSRSSKKGFAKKKTGGGGAGGVGFGKTPKIVLTHKPDTSPPIQALIQFLSSQNAKGLAVDGSEGTQIGYDPKTGIRGLYATQSFQKGDILCRIPSDCALALSDPNDKDTPPEEMTVAHSGRNLLQMYTDHPQASLLWKPYLDTLPSMNDDGFFTPTPDFYDKDEIQLLEFPRIQRLARERQQQVDTVAKEADMDPAKLRFATWLVSSRSFSISMTEQQDENDGSDNEEAMAPVDDMGRVISKRSPRVLRVLVPYLDLANHAADGGNGEIHLIDPEKDDAWFSIRATRPIPAGREICICYGTGVDSSVEFLMNYGFVPNHNKIDALLLQKGDDDCIVTPDGWTTTLEEDQLMLPEAEGTLRDILAFRVRLKQAYLELQQQEAKNKFKRSK